MVGIGQGREGVGKGDAVGLTIEENEEDESEALSVFKKQEQKRCYNTKLKQTYVRYGNTHTLN